MNKRRILIVEDDPAFARVMEEGLREVGCDVLAVTASAEEAVEQARLLVPEVVLMDIDLNGPMDGVEAAMRIHDEMELPVVFVTGHQDEPTIERATLSAAFGYIIKPFQIKDLQAAIEIACYKWQMNEIQARAQDAEYGLLQKTLGGTVEVLTEILSAVEPESFGRGQKLKFYIGALADHVEARSKWELEMAAMVAGIGNVCLPPRIIDKVRAGLALDAFERKMAVRVPEFGRNLLSRIPRLDGVGSIVYFQNKNWDGTGFPDCSTAGPDIPQGARMLRILLDFLELREGGVPKVRLIDEMRSAKGKYDPELLEAAIASVVNPPPKESEAIMLDEVRVGHILTAPIEAEDDLQLVSAETVITSLIREKLNHFSQFSKIVEPIFVKRTR